MIKNTKIYVQISWYVLIIFSIILIYEHSFIAFLMQIIYIGIIGLFEILFVYILLNKKLINKYSKKFDKQKLANKIYIFIFFLFILMLNYIINDIESSFQISFLIFILFLTMFIKITRLQYTNTKNNKRDG